MMAQTNTNLYQINQLLDMGCQFFNFLIFQPPSPLSRSTTYKYHQFLFAFSFLLMASSPSFLGISWILQVFCNTLFSSLEYLFRVSILTLLHLLFLTGRGCSSMSRENETENIEFHEEETEEGVFDEDRFYAKEIIYSVGMSLASRPRILSDGQLPLKMTRYDGDWCLDLNLVLSSCGHGKLDLPYDPQDADYVTIPKLGFDLETMILPRIPIELETMILARTGILEFRKLCMLNKRILELVKNGELLKERREIGVKEASVFMLATGEQNWWAFDQHFSTHEALPTLPCDEMFKLIDKESLCVGTHLLVCGIECDGPIIWTYDLIMNQWYKGSSMIEPRCLFASASCGDLAFVAGGISSVHHGVLNSAEKYDPESKSWDPLPKMKERRKMCSGVYMDKKFYVIGGQDGNGEALTCAEVFHEDENTWVKIPGMLNGFAPAPTALQSPPLLAVVNDELYLFEPSSNCLKVYLKNSISWKDLGHVPVRADLNKGWGVAFKSLGDKLLVIGGSTSTISLSGRGGMTIYTCCPNPSAEKLDWKLIDGGNSKSPFILNCTVMIA